MENKDFSNFINVPNVVPPWTNVEIATLLYTISKYSDPPNTGSLLPVIDWDFVTNTIMAYSGNIRYLYIIGSIYGSSLLIRSYRQCQELYLALRKSFGDSIFELYEKMSNDCLYHNKFQAELCSYIRNIRQNNNKYSEYV